MSKRCKRLISAFLAVLMIAMVMAPTGVYAAETEKENNRSVFYWQRDAKWGYGRAGYSACYLSSFAMIITNLGHEDATPADMYKANNHSSYMIQSRITSKYDVSWKRISVYGKSTDYKIEMVKELLEECPQGVIVRNSGHTMIAIGVTDDGTIVFNDPAYSDGHHLLMGDTQLGRWSNISYIETIR